MLLPIALYLGGVQRITVLCICRNTCINMLHSAGSYLSKRLWQEQTICRIKDSGLQTIAENTVHYQTSRMSWVPLNTVCLHNPVFTNSKLRNTLHTK